MQDKLARLWAWLRDVQTVVRPGRVSAVVVVAGALLLLSPQGREFTVRLPGEGAWKMFWFQLGVFLWALQSWYWARVLLDLTFGAASGADHGRYETLRRRTPRALALFAYTVAALACAFSGAGWAGWKITLAVVVEGALFIAFLVYRRTHLIPRLERADPGSLKHKVLLGRGGPGPMLRFALPRELHSLPLFSRIIAALSFVQVIALTAWVCIDAVGFGWRFGAAAVPFLGFSVIVPVGSLLVLLSREGGASRLGGPRGVEAQRGYPVVTTLVLVAVAFSLVPALDNHKVRTLAGSREAGRPLDEVLDRWYAQAPLLADGRTKNLVVVATAGGGLRAAYWTATVLGAVQDEVPSFRRQVAGISGVSGGSLGATVFVTLLGQTSLPPAASRCAQAGIEVGPYECAGQSVLTQDFLGPTVAALLFPDLIHRFLPLGFPDRAKALEQSWERAWPEAGFPERIWEGRGFRTLWADKGFLPALFLNGTHVETGRRVITSNVDVAASPGVFRDAYDFYELAPAGRDVRPSTAAHNSARFTYVSPASTLGDGTHLVDGGYFENFGAVTARELLERAIERFEDKVRPIVILVSNDPKLREDDLPRDPPIRPRRVGAGIWPHEVMSPLLALLNTRDARGLLAASHLRAIVEGQEGRYFQFRLCGDASRPEPALGWVLSDDSETLMRQQLREACGNDAQMAKLVEALTGRKPAAAPPQ